MGTTDDFADARHKQVHGGDGESPFTVRLVGAHVKRFDAFRVIINGDGTFEVLLGEETFVFGLQVDAPGDGVVKFLAAVFKDFYGFGVGDALKGFF